jgi:hypothetical protein
MTMLLVMPKAFETATEASLTLMLGVLVSC